MAHRDHACLGALALLVGLLMSATGGHAASDAVHLSYVTSLGARHAHPGLAEPGALPVTAEFGHNDTRLVLSRADGTVEAWDINRRAIDRVYGTKGLIAYACHADAILIQTQDDLVQLVGLADDARVTTTAGAYVGAIAEDCSTVVMQPADGGAEVWDLGTLIPGRTVAAPRAAGSSLALSPDGLYMATAHGLEGDEHHTVIDIWDIERDALRVRIDPGAAEVPLGVWHVVFSPDGSRVAADSREGGKSGFRVWDASIGDELLRREDSPSYWTRALAWSADGRFMASGDERGEVVLWDARSGAELDRLHSHQVVQSLAFADDGGRLAVGLWDSSVELWRVVDGAVADDIHRATARGDLATARAMLEADPMLANSRPNGKPAPLLYAAMSRDLEMTALLLEHGATPGDHPSPLSMAMTRPWLDGSYDVARLLADAGAEADFHAAVQLGLEERVAEILRDDPSQVNRTDWGIAPVDVAAEAGLVTVGRMLIDAGAAVNVFAAASFGLMDRVRAFVEADASLVEASRPQGGYTPLHCAAETGQSRVAEYLIGHGADIHARNYWGFRPLHLATLGARGGVSEPGHVEIARMLLERGADPYALDDYDRTPWTFVESSGNPDLTRLFESYPQDTQEDD